MIIFIRSINDLFFSSFKIVFQLKSFFTEIINRFSIEKRMFCIYQIIKVQVGVCRFETRVIEFDFATIRLDHSQYVVNSSAKCWTCSIYSQRRFEMDSILWFLFSTSKNENSFSKKIKENDLARLCLCSTK